MGNRIAALIAIGAIMTISIWSLGCSAGLKTGAMVPATANRKMATRALQFGPIPDPRVPNTGARYHPTMPSAPTGACNHRSISWMPFPPRDRI